VICKFWYNASTTYHKGIPLQLTAPDNFDLFPELIPEPIIDSTPTCEQVLLLGDCLSVMNTLPEKSVDLILTDLPYGTTNARGDNPIALRQLWVRYKRLLKPTGCVLIFGNNPFTAQVVLSNQEWYKQTLIWDKNKCGSPGLANIRPMQIHEDIVVFAPKKTVYNPQMTVGEPYERQTDRPEGYEGKSNTHGYGLKPVKGFKNEGTRFPRSIIRISRDFSAQQQVHPHQKPTELLEYLIKTYSNVGDVVLDSCVGSGSTLIAARNTGRYGIGIENDPVYFEIAKTRLGL